MSQVGITQFPQLPLIKSQILCHHKELPGRLTVQCCCCKCQSKEEVARERAQGHLCRVLLPGRLSVGACSFFWRDWICLCHLIIALYSSTLPACFILGCKKSYYILHNRRTEGATSSELQYCPCRVSFSPYQPKHTHTFLLYGVSTLQANPLTSAPASLCFLCCWTTMFSLHMQEPRRKIVGLLCRNLQSWVLIWWGCTMRAPC